MISSWGMVAGTPDGEDSKGRAQAKLATPKELTNRAFEIADLMFEEFETRDWSIQLPTYETMNQAVQNINEEKENNKSLNKGH